MSHSSHRLRGRRLPVARIAVGIVAGALISAACTGCAAPAAAREITILSYNVQNLFDDVDDGGEYAEFSSSGGWDRSAYYRRLERVDEVVRRLPGMRRPDIVALQEIESPRVAHDLARDFLRRYRYIVAGEPGRTTTQAVVLSRLRPDVVRAHQVSEVVLDPGSGPRTVWRSRDLVDVTYDRPAVRLLVAHWKSQSGGEEETEPYRIREAELVRTLIVTSVVPGVGVTLLVGDLNEDVEEYRQHGGAWETAMERLKYPSWGPVFRSLWDGVPFPGTYFYRGRWERLDQALLVASPDVAASLLPVAVPYLLRDDGTPDRYDVRSRSGYSDHLPILITVTIPRSP